MKKSLFLFFVLIFSSVLTAETLHYYVEGRKVELTEDFSSYSFIRTSLTKANFTLPQAVKVLKKQNNVSIIEITDTAAKENLAKNGSLFPAYIKEGVKVYVSGMIFVKIPGKLTGKNAEKWCEKNGMKFVKQYQYIPEWYLVSVEGNPVKKAAELVENKIAEAAEPSFFIPLKRRAFIPNDPLFVNQWHLHNSGSDSTLSGNDHAHVAEAWEVMKAFKGNTGGKGINLAIVDDGFDLDHEDFAGRFAAGYDFADNDNDPTYDPDKYYPDEHGTACAGVAGAATDNGKGVAGACPNCTLIPIRMDMDGYSLDEPAIESFEWAANAGADIISNSWGPADNDGAVDMNTALKNLVANLTSTGRNGKGIIILFAAGNGGESIDDSRTKDGFAGNPNVFAIGATKADGIATSYSDYGPSLDFMAPSSDFADVDNDNDGYYDTMDGIWTVDNAGRDGYNTGNKGQFGGSCSARSGCSYGLTCSSSKCVGKESGFTGTYSDYSHDFGGTSSACPLAAGITGLVLAANRNLTRDDVYELYVETSDKVGNKQYTNGFNNYYGYGRINACEAVKKALEMAGKNVSQVTCGGTVINPDPIDDTDTDEPDTTDTTDTSDTTDTTDTGDTGDSTDTSDTSDTTDTTDTGDTGDSTDTSDTTDTTDTSDSTDTSDTTDTDTEISENCGNGFLDDGEQCDDGNRISGDGCSKYCMKEAETKSKSGGCSLDLI